MANEVQIFELAESDYTPPKVVEQITAVAIAVPDENGDVRPFFVTLKREKPSPIARELKGENG